MFLSVRDFHSCVKRSEAVRYYIHPEDRTCPTRDPHLREVVGELLITNYYGPGELLITDD